MHSHLLHHIDHPLLLRLNILANAHARFLQPSQAAYKAKLTTDRFHLSVYLPIYLSSMYRNGMYVNIVTTNVN